MTRIKYTLGFPQLFQVIFQESELHGYKSAFHCSQQSSCLLLPKFTFLECLQPRSIHLLILWCIVLIFYMNPATQKKSQTYIFECLYTNLTLHVFFLVPCTSVGIKCSAYSKRLLRLSHFINSILEHLPSFSCSSCSI